MARTALREKASAEIRGEFLRTKSWVNFAGDFLVDFFGPFSLEKNSPVGQKRQIDVAGQKLPRDNFCLSLVSQLPSPRG